MVKYVRTPFPGSSNVGTLAVDDGEDTPLSVSAPSYDAKISKDTTFNVDATINDLRLAYRLQLWLENNARCGSRYVEQLRSHFGVTSSDGRLQRPELLGGGSIPLIVTDVENTSATNDNGPQGNLAGKGTMYGKTNGFKKYFEEHGWIIGVFSIIPRTLR